jgi:thiamine kinase-like enzyme
MLLRDGLTNDSWLVRTAHGDVVVRINNPHAQALQIDRRIEAQILTTVGAAGIGPEVLLCDPNRHVLVTRYLGPACSAADLHAPSRLMRVGALLKRLHSVPASDQFGRVLWQDVIGDYTATLTTLNRDTPLLRDDLSARAHAVAVEIENSAGLVCVCHNDVHYLNIVDNGGLRLLDWEYAGIGDPYFDLASVAFYHDLRLDERALLLRAYEGEVNPASLQRLAKACFVFEYVHELWHEVRTAITTGV